MKALSLWQPHAQAISLGIKKYETRGWSTAYRGPLAIHAAKKPFRYQDYPIDYYHEVSRRLKAAGFPIYALDYGKVLCVVDLVDCVQTKKIRAKFSEEWDEETILTHYGPGFWGDFRDKGDDGKDRYAFKLENVRLIPALKRPAVTGRQGFFNVPDELIVWE
jgi:hypothetical protein